MRADERFLRQPRHFWANVRSISQALGYTEKKTRNVKVYRVPDMVRAMKKLGLGTHHLIVEGATTSLASTLEAYFAYRADVLNSFVEPRLMDSQAARALFNELRQRCDPHCPLPSNKQKAEKAGPAFLTGVVNMLIESASEGLPVNYDPQQLTTITIDNVPLRTLSRRVDGAFPSPVNPIAVWEIKEYYYTTTFGSRIADGVFETQLDGMELEELGLNENILVEHVLIVDAYFTWWTKGRSYLCRIVDMLHMGLVDEVLFGREVVDVLPELVGRWVEAFRAREATRA